MAGRFAVGDKVFVPSSRIGIDDLPSVFWETTVAGVANKRIKVNLRGGATSEWIGTSLCHKNIGILILTIGDLETEATLLDPLAKSVLQYCRLLVPDDYVRAYKIRSLKELKTIWQAEQRNYSHVILIGHGSQQGIKFANDGWAAPEAIEETLKVRGAPRKIFISLCCQTGYQVIGGALSEMAISSHFIGPFHSVHGAVASQFAQTFLAYHLLEGETTNVAFRHARESTPGSTSFRLWKNGVLTAGPRA
jgi:hypothetical protein